MIAIRKAWWATALLAAFAGCNTEEPGAGTNPPPPAAPGGAAPGTEVTPSSEKKDEMPKPADEAPAAKSEEPGKTEEPAKKDSEPAAPKDKDESTEKKADAQVKLSSEEVAEIEKLPAADKSLALKQIVCPVSEEPLGSMGTPVKVTAEGKTFFLCCKGCTKEVTNHPKDVVAKLKTK